MFNNKSFPDKISKIILIFLFMHIKTIYGFTCYFCQGADCQRESQLNATVECIPFDECVTVFYGFSIVQRGCFSELPDIHQKECNDPYSINCHICSDNLCNNLGPTKCVQCQEKDNFLCMYHSERITARRCPLTSLRLVHCYFTRYYDSDHKLFGRMERGCLMNAQAEAECKRDPKCTDCLPEPGFACNTKHEGRKVGTFEDSPDKGVHQIDYELINIIIFFAGFFLYLL